LKIKCGNKIQIGGIFEGVKGRRGEVIENVKCKIEN